jgi:transposase-like protein
MKFPPNPYSGYRYPTEIISYAVWLYHRFTLSFREIEEKIRGQQNPGFIRSNFIAF